MTRRTRPGIAPLQAYPARVFDPAHPAETSPPEISASAVVTDARGTGTIGFGTGPSYESAADAARDCGIGPGCQVRALDLLARTKYQPK